MTWCVFVTLLLSAITSLHVTPAILHWCNACIRWNYCCFIPG